MISKKLIKKVEELTYLEYKKYGMPSLFQVEYVNEIGQKLANRHKVDANVVLLGTILMDSQLGKAYSKGNLVEHIKMSEDYARDILESDADITNSETENILSCIRQHHGTKKFDTMESEVVCNADCYKFASVIGMLGSIRTTRDMELTELVGLLLNKANEKWNALSLLDCKDEINNEYKVIVNFLGSFKA